jgi:hypothetical protein
LVVIHLDPVDDRAEVPFRKAELGAIITCASIMPSVCGRTAAQVRGHVDVMDGAIWIERLKLIRCFPPPRRRR